MSFDNWFNKMEVHSTRSDRFWDDMYDTFGMLPEGPDDYLKVMNWLRAAYEAGKDESFSIPPTQISPNPYVPTIQLPPLGASRCIRCGISLNGVMGYVCTDSHCPTQPRITSIGDATPMTSQAVPFISSFTYTKIE